MRQQNEYLVVPAFPLLNRLASSDDRIAQHSLSPLDWSASCHRILTKTFEQMSRPRQSASSSSNISLLSLLNGSLSWAVLVVSDLLGFNWCTVARCRFKPEVEPP